ncbi:hypothetical protein ABWW58_01475 [Sporolactobacillus sp. STCC-11]|uniref:hypothetical protein n=1 Tax=Sporolactobacillus caesalpiniae TaxID=3230362 RepID=UPI003392D3E8
MTVDHAGAGNKLKKYKSKFIGIIVILIIFGAGYYVVGFGGSENWENVTAIKDVNRVLASKNKKEINAIAANETTRKFFLTIRKGTKCKSTSGFQGEEPNGWHYYGTEINNRDFDLSVEPEKKNNLFDYIFPGYKLVKITMQ